MATFVYRPQSSTGARELANALEANRWRRTTPGLRQNDAIVCWGASQPPAISPAMRVRVLNGARLRNKFEDAVRLREAGVITVEVSRTRPVAAPVVIAANLDPALALWERLQETANAFDGMPFSRSPVAQAGIVQLSQAAVALSGALRIAAPVTRPAPVVEWIPRMFSHVGGNDLLDPSTTPNYWSRKLNLVEEYRIHSFMGRSIRAGRKVPRLNMVPHVWIRSYDGGWKINYDHFESTRPMRDLAHAAVAALDLQFGAVDIGRTLEGAFVVLEVNRAPGLEGGTVTSYATAIRGWLNGAAPGGE